MKKIFAFLIPTLLCFLIGWVSAWVQTDALTEWYPYLIKSAATPPNIIFPIVWSILYICIGVSAGLVMSSSKGEWRTTMLLWFMQLLLNFLWSFFFFALQSPILALIDLALLFIVVLLYIVAACSTSRAAAWLMVPYLCWTLFAAYLNGFIVFHN